MEKPAINLEGIIRECRMSICEAFFTGQHAAALAAVAAASIRLYYHVEAGSLISHVAGDMLWDVSENLGLVRTLGQRVVDVAIDAGPALYDALAATERDSVAHGNFGERAA